MIGEVSFFVKQQYNSTRFKLSGVMIAGAYSTLSIPFQVLKETSVECVPGVPEGLQTLSSVADRCTYVCCGPHTHVASCGHSGM